MKIVDEQNNELVITALDYNIGYLTEKENGVYVYHYFTESQLAERKIPELKQKLAETDYQPLKYLDGEYTEEEYAVLKAQRQAWREEIRQLEEKL